jgi:hypothetical protein
MGVNRKIHKFDRISYDCKQGFTYLGDGELGGKAHGLKIIYENIIDSLAEKYSDITIDIPNLTVLTTSCFDRFIKYNKLEDVAYSESSEQVIKNSFLRAELPPELVGDLRTLISKTHIPLAIRSSSLIEDSMQSPFAGIYGTKMIPNNQLDVDSRFRKLTEAIKCVYATTFYPSSKAYMRTTNNRIEDEKMAIIIQEVIGKRYDDLYYPEISGVLKSYNFYPIGKAEPEDGIVNIGLGLGKIIVDGGWIWSYSPEYPNLSPPYSSPGEMLKQTQTNFWVINMGKPPAFDPMNESEYLLTGDLEQAEKNDNLLYLASTYDSYSDRIDFGISGKGPRVLNFAPLLQTNIIPFNQIIDDVKSECEKVLNSHVEVEFAMNLKSKTTPRARFSLLQVRPMAVSDDFIEINESDFKQEQILVKSEMSIGNGIIENIRDIVFVKPDNFDIKNSREIAKQIEKLNYQLIKDDKPYLLIGFGRWGSSDPWLGIPVNWSHISGAKAIVESTLPNINVDLSQGSHFFHNLANLKIPYLSIKHTDELQIDWKWLETQQVVNEAEYVKHISNNQPLKILVDGRSKLGVIVK